jgi:hypothetical protein
MRQWNVGAAEPTFARGEIKLKSALGKLLSFAQNATVPLLFDITDSAGNVSAQA